MAKDEKKDEGARGFAVLIQQMEDGALHAELSETVQAVTKELTGIVDHFGIDAKGQITIVLSLAARGNGTVCIDAEIKTKTPKPKRAGSVFWPTASGNLSPENPRQGRLPLREVPMTAHAPVDVPADERPVRTI